MSLFARPAIGLVCRALRPALVQALLLTCVGGLLAAVPPVSAQDAPAEVAPGVDLPALIQRLKADPRGPFQGLRWFCPDGSVRPPQSRCAQPGGKQHGLLKDEVLRLQRTHHVFLDPVLTGTPPDSFWDEVHRQSRLKQYLLQRYLFGVDEGWILRRAQFYRGALQAEDEAEWSRQFLTWLVHDERRLTTHFYLARELVRGLPLERRSDLQQRIRAVSAEISDDYPPFLDLRVKLHGQPDSTDLVRVQQFRRAHREDMSPQLIDRTETLESLLRQAFTGSPLEYIRANNRRLGPSTALAQRLDAYLESADGASPSSLITQSAALLWHLRIEVSALPPAQRLAALEVSVGLEDAILRSAARWSPSTVGALTEKIFALAQAAAGAGFLEVWEWTQAGEQLRPPEGPTWASPDLQRHAERARRVADWATGTVFGVYQPVVEQYEEFEPRARGFLDDRIRGSVLLALGAAVGDLAGVAAGTGGLSNDVFGLAEGRRVQGLNPGVALGELEVVSGAAEARNLAPEKIYVFRQPPSELTPVAGIASVMQGNVVSHVQLLARSLSIPNATVPSSLVDQLRTFAGERVFYAVSPGGAVVLKRARDMTAPERQLVRAQETSRPRLAVPTDRMDLEMQRLLPLDSIRAIDAGRICGPKAATMGELETLFPERVTEGLVIPFGVFRAHMEQPMPGTEGSYWSFVEATFEASPAPARASARDSLITARLRQLRAAVRSMPLRAEFVSALRHRYPPVFGHPLGQGAVFVRSDTNMEDLKDFSGAGLNLTVPNLVDEATLLDAIREVWASVYSERSYQWRQRALSNPEDIYPSVLLQRSVNVEASGVLLTTGLAHGGAADVTVAFNRGVGGAVDGQSAETWLLRMEGPDEVLAPSRDPTYRVLADRGGIEVRSTSFETPILSPQRRAALRSVASEVRARLPKMPGIHSQGPFDVELGFEGERLWLFQARPFVESPHLRSVKYLQSLDRRARSNGRISLTAPLRP